MSVQAKIKTAGDSVLICRGPIGARELECGWSLVRVEPESGNAICERGERRLICPRREFELLNFPGSDDLWKIIADPKDESLLMAKRAWAGLDLLGAVSALRSYARKLDPAFNGVQTNADLVEKIREKENACKRSMDLLRLEIKRARVDYERFAARTGLEYDEKDSLLSRVRDMENKYAALEHRYGIQLPAWHRLTDAIENMATAAKNEINIA